MVGSIARLTQCAGGGGVISSFKWFLPASLRVGGMGGGAVQGGRAQHALAWPGWKPPDIAVEVDTARLNTSRFKKCCEKCVLLYYPSTEFKGVVNVYWHGEEAAWLFCTELSI